MSDITTTVLDTTVLDTTVLVVGAGPVGLTAARLLADAGHPVTVLERRRGPQSAPAAHVVNARTLEILRQTGVDMDAIAALAKDPTEAGDVNFVTRLGGDLIGRLPFERQGDECLAHTPTPLRNISQHRLEPLLATEAAGSGVDVRYGWDWVSADQDDDGVTSVVRHTATGTEHRIRSRSLLGADGAGSRVRKWLGIDMIGPANIQSFVAVHLLADLRAVVAGRPGVLHFVMDPATPGTFVAHDPAREWVFMTPFDPSAETLDDYPPERCAALARAAIGEAGAGLDLEVAWVGTWHMTAQVAERYGSGRVHLLGDAAHRFPPTGGMGLNTGVADAHNLVWKLDAVERGWADPALLDTYETERRPVAEVNCEQSTTNAVQLVRLIEALGDDPAAALAQAAADPERHDAIADAVAAQATHFDMLGLQIGYVYDDGALLRAEGAAPPAPVTDPGHFDPDGAVGSRLPHTWLDDGRSVLDLIRPGALTLMTAGDHDRWAAALTEAVGATAVSPDPPVHHVRLGLDATVGEDWPAWRTLAPEGALLVRPDQHVAWASPGEAAPDELAAALAAVTGR